MVWEEGDVTMRSLWRPKATKVTASGSHNDSDIGQRQQQRVAEWLPASALHTCFCSRFYTGEGDCTRIRSRCQMFSRSRHNDERLIGLRCRGICSLEPVQIAQQLFDYLVSNVGACAFVLCATAFLGAGPDDVAICSNQPDSHAGIVDRFS